MFTALGIYPDSFEKPFLEGTSEFYAGEGVKYMQQADVPDYLKHVEVRILVALNIKSSLLRRAQSMCHLVMCFVSFKHC